MKKTVLLAGVLALACWLPAGSPAPDFLSKNVGLQGADGKFNEVSEAGKMASKSAAKVLKKTGSGLATDDNGVVTAVAVASGDKNKEVTYFDFDVPLTGDITGKAICFSARTTTPELTQAFYVRGYNRENQCILSYKSWDGRLETGPKEFRLNPGRHSAGLTWERELVKEDADQTLAHLRFFIGTRGNAGSSFDGIIENIRLEDAGAAAAVPITTGELLGIGARSAEIRSLIATVDRNGNRLILVRTQDHGPDGYLLLTEVDSGRTLQYFNPPNLRQGDSFGSLLTKDGKFYYDMTGARLLCFDLNTRKTVSLGRPDPEAAHFIVYTEAPDGTVYLGGFPKALLSSYRPADGQVRNYGRLDPEEAYTQTLATDRNNYVYAGIGTARANIVALNPVSGEITQILPEELRGLGSGTVISGADGYVYASYKDFKVKLLDGKIVERDVEPGEPRDVTAPKYGVRLTDFPDGSKVVEYDLYRKIARVQEPDGSLRTLDFDFTSGGLGFTSLGAGPDGRIYASTSHPMHLVEYDPARNRLIDHGPNPVVRGGNFCNFAAGKDKIYACEYAGGRLWEYDPAREVSFSDTEPGFGGDNPRILGRWQPLVTRPRAIVVHPDGEHVIIAGFAGYGLAGGGFGVHNLKTGENSEISDWLPGHSCIALRVLPNGDLIAGTSVNAPGGGHKKATAAAIAVIDWTERKLKKSLELDGVANVVSIELWRDKLFAATADGRLFRLDPETLAIEKIESVSSYGSIPRNALQKTPDDRLFLLQSETILEIDPATLEPVTVGWPPQAITAGGGYADGCLYFACHTQLARFRIPPAAK